MSKVITFRGKAGVGKTTLSDAVAQKLNIPVIRKDDIYDAVAPFLYEHEFRNKICYDVLYKMIETNIINGVDIIVDAGFHDLDVALKFRDWVQNKNAQFKSFLCICSKQEVWAERFNRRSLDPKPNNLITDFETLKCHYKNMDTEALSNETSLDTMDNIENIVNKVVSEIIEGEYI